MDFLNKIENNDIKIEIENYINNLKAQYNSKIETLKGEVETYKGKITEKENEVIKIKSILGIDEDLPINDELIKSKLGEFKNEDLSKIEEKYNNLILELNEKFKNEKSEIENKLKSLEEEKRNLFLENKLKEIIPNINPQTGALEDIISNLKQNAEVGDNGEIVYKQGEVVLRDENGLPVNLNTRLKQLKNQKPYLFKSEVQEGGGTNNNSNIPIVNSNSFSSKMIARAKSLGLQI